MPILKYSLEKLSFELICQIMRCFLRFQTKNIWENRQGEGGTGGMKWLQKFHVVDLTQGRNVKPSKLLVGQDIKPLKGTYTDALMPMQGSL